MATAQSASQSNPIASANFKDWTGKVLALMPVNINANRNSFQVNIKHRSAVEASPYNDNGSVILKIRILLVSNVHQVRPLLSALSISPRKTLLLAKW